MDVDLEIMTSNRNHKNLDYLNYRNRYNSKTRSHQNLAHGLGYANGSFSNLSQSQLNDNSGSRKSLKNLFLTTITRRGSNHREVITIAQKLREKLKISKWRLAKNGSQNSFPVELRALVLTVRKLKL